MSTELYYSNWRELDSHLVWVYEGRPIRGTGRFGEKQLTAWLLTEGKLNVAGAKPRQIHAGNWVFAGQANATREFSDDAKILSIKFVLRWPDGRLMFEPSHVLTCSAEEFPELNRTARCLLRYVKRCRLSAGNLMQYQALSLRDYVRINQLFQAWLLAYIDYMESVGQAPQHSRREDTRIIKARQLIDAHPLSERLPLESLASRLGLSLGHADTLFHASFGQTMRSYFDQRRYMAAMHLLDKTSKPIKEIAYELGFSDSTALTHWFRKKSGVPPTVYRKDRG